MSVDEWRRFQTQKDSRGLDIMEMRGKRQAEDFSDGGAPRHGVPGGLDQRGAELAARRAAESVLAGRTGLVTLTASATSTTITNPLIRWDSPIVLTPTTASCLKVDTIEVFISETGRVNGSVVITHTSSTLTDRTYRYFVC